MAVAPRPASSWADGSVTTPGMTSNHRRTTRNHEPLTTSADSTALAAAGAPACAGGSQMCSGNSAVLASRPTVINVAAAHAMGSGWTRPDSNAISSVPYPPYSSTAPSRYSSDPASANSR